MLDLNFIRTDGGTQSRLEVNTDVVAEYAEAYKAGAKFPPVTVFYDGKSWWLADGFHRYWAAQSAGLTEIYENITPGTKQDAFVFSLGANNKHGLKRTHADKRHAVELALGNDEISVQSDVAIAKICAVSSNFVGDVRRSIINLINDTTVTAPSIINLINDRPEFKTRTVERNGKTYEQKVANIGRRLDSDTPEIQQPATNNATPRMGLSDEEEPPEYTELDQAQDQIKDLQADLALAAMGNVSEELKTMSKDIIENLQAENKVLSASLNAVTQSRDSLMQEVVQLKKQCQMQRREIDKLKSNF